MPTSKTRLRAMRDVPPRWALLLAMAGVHLLGSPRVARAQSSDGSGQSAAAAPADASAQAKRDFLSGLDALRAGEWAAAERCLQRSFERVPRASTAFNLALSRLHLGKPLQALDALDAAQALGAAGDSALDGAQVEALRARALSQLAVLELHVRPARAEVWLDGWTMTAPVGSPFRLRLTPGMHQIRIAAEGHIDLELHLEVAAGEHHVRTVALERTPQLPALSTAPPAAVPSPSMVEPPQADPHPRLRRARRTLAALGAGLALVAIPTGVGALRADRQVHRECPDLVCDAALREELQPVSTRAGRYSIATDVLLATGGTALVTALLTYAVHRRRDRGRAVLRPFEFRF